MAAEAAQASRTFRLFVSRPSRTSRPSANALQQYVFPRLAELCASRNARFQAVDLRWGVSEEASLDQRAIPICLTEIERCQRMTPRPNFIVLLGDRYGWRPLPARIGAEEFEEILAMVPEDDARLLVWVADQPAEAKGWYRCDENGDPREYVLRPREVAIGEGATAEQRKVAQQAEYDRWGNVIEKHLRAILLDAITSLGWSADDPRMQKYVASATRSRSGGTISPRSPRPATTPAALWRSCGRPAGCWPLTRPPAPGSSWPGATRADGTADAAGRALSVFFTSCGLALPGDEARRRAAARRHHFLAAIPAGLARAVIAFSDSELGERGRARRAGRRPLSDITLEARLRILRDLSVHLATSGPVTSWAEVTTGDPEGFLSCHPRSRHQDTYVKRRFFAFARQRKLILADPASPLRLGAQPGFTGTVLGSLAKKAGLVHRQRVVVRREIADARDCEPKTNCRRACGQRGGDKVGERPRRTRGHQRTGLPVSPDTR